MIDVAVFAVSMTFVGAFGTPPGNAIGGGDTKVTWTLHYRRSLDPAWYFGPWERYAARLAAGYLIDSVATP